jgi:hypothetical protein
MIFSDNEGRRPIITNLRRFDQPNGRNSMHAEMKRLAGKKALVTGGSRGIGAAIVHRLAQEEAEVAFTYRAGVTPQKKSQPKSSPQVAKVCRFRSIVRTLRFDEGRRPSR